MSKVKALVWEECRVGGVIALGCVALDVLLMVAYRLQLQVTYVGGIESVGYFAMSLGVPILMAVSMTMNPNHKGYLSGGYPQRILQLPIPTYLPVAVSLAARLLFMVGATTLIVLISKTIFTDGFAYALVLVAMLVFLAVQLIDWLRGPLSGLTSFVALSGLAVAAYILVFSSSNNVARSITVWITDPIGHEVAGALVVSALLLVCIFLMSIVAVGTARKGRRYGVPEIWTWHKVFNFGSSGRIAPFESPLTARIWLEFRRSGFILPIVTGFLCVVLYVGLRLYRGDPTPGTEGRNAYLTALVPVAALLIGALSHTIKTNVLPFRRSKGMSGYTFLQPYTTEQIAYARIVSNAIQLALTLAVVMFLHFNLPGVGFFLEAIPEALAMGTTSMREVIWIALGRSVAIGLVAWVLMAASTRLVLLNVLALPVLSVLTFFGRGLAVLQGHWMRFGEVLTLAVSAFLIFVCAVTFFRLIRKNMVSKHMAAFWIGLWGVLGCLIAVRSVVSLNTMGVPMIWQASMVFVSLGLASSIPLPFLATILDVHKKRHSASPRQDSTVIEKPMTWNTLSHAQKVRASLLGAAIAFAVFMAWPSRPAYQKLRAETGRVSSVAELDAFANTIPEDENAALKYRQIAQAATDLAVAFFNDYNKKTGHGREMWNDDFENTLVFGAADIKRAKPIDPEVRRLSILYWSNITSKITPEIIEATKAIPVSRLPVSYANDFGGDAFMQYLAETRALSRDLKLNALCWAMQNEPEKAADSIIATFRLGEAVGREPVLMAQMVSVGIMGNGLSALEQTLNCIALPPAELERIQGFLDTLRRENRLDVQFKRGMAGESVINMGYTPMHQKLIMNKGRRFSRVISAPWDDLLYSWEAERLLIATAYENLFHFSANSFEEFETQEDKGEESVQHAHIAPMAGILFDGAIYSSYEAVLRFQTQLDVARVALACDRFRLANDRFPIDLDELVPKYISEIPEDFYGLDEVPPGGNLAERPKLRYDVRQNEIAVYSISKNQRDDFGIDEIRNPYRDGDITFTISTIKANSLEPPASATD
jgi:hypothetical protein